MLIDQSRGSTKMSLLGQRDILESIVQFSGQREEEGILAAGDKGIEIVFFDE
jgi:hypothetical protein